MVNTADILTDHMTMQLRQLMMVQSTMCLLKSHKLGDGLCGLCIIEVILFNSSSGGFIGYIFVYSDKRLLCNCFVNYFRNKI